MDDIATSTSTSNGHATKQYPDRTCPRCKKKFTPLTARERRCTECTGLPRRRSPAKAKAAAPAKRGRPRRADVVEVSTPAAVATSRNSTTWQASPVAPAARAPQPSGVASAVELLELAGYKVTAVRTPAGEFLRVL